MKDEIHSLETKLGIYKSQLEELKNKKDRQSNKLWETLEAEAEVQLKHVEAQIKLAKEKGVAAWDTIKGGVEDAFSELKSSVEKATNKLS